MNTAKILATAATLALLAPATTAFAWPGGQPAAPCAAHGGYGEQVYGEATLVPGDGCGLAGAEIASVGYPADGHGYGWAGHGVEGHGMHGYGHGGYHHRQDRTVDRILRRMDRRLAHGAADGSIPADAMAELEQHQMELHRLLHLAERDHLVDEREAAHLRSLIDEQRMRIGEARDSAREMAAVEPASARTVEADPAPAPVMAVEVENAEPGSITIVEVPAMEPGVVMDGEIVQASAETVVAVEMLGEGDPEASAIPPVPEETAAEKSGAKWLSW